MSEKSAHFSSRQLPDPPSPVRLTPKPKTAASARAVQVHHRLCKAYGCPIRYFHDIDPLNELVSALLSHRADCGRG